MLIEVYGGPALKHAVATKNDGAWEKPLGELCREVIGRCLDLTNYPMEFYFHTESNGYGDWDLFIELSVTSRADQGRGWWSGICERMEESLREQIGDIRVRVEPMAVLLRS